MSYTNRLEEAVRQAESASEIARQWANGPENTTIPTESGQLPTLAEFMRQNAESLVDAAEVRNDLTEFMDLRADVSRYSPVAAINTQSGSFDYVVQSGSATVTFENAPNGIMAMKVVTSGGATIRLPALSGLYFNEQAYASIIGNASSGVNAVNFRAYYSDSASWVYFNATNSTSVNNSSDQGGQITKSYNPSHAVSTGAVPTVITSLSPTELVLNGSFDSTINWSLSGGATIGGGKLTINSTDGSMSSALQTNRLTVGKYYLIEADITILSGSGGVAISDNNTGQIVTTSSGRLSGIILATSTGVQIKRGTPGLAVTAEVDNVSIKEVLSFEYTHKFPLHAAELIVEPVSGQTATVYIFAVGLGYKRKSRICISLDDGFSSAFNYLPAFLGRGLKCTFGVMERVIGTQGYATYAQLRSALNSGCELVAHGPTSSSGNLPSNYPNNAHAAVADMLSTVQWLRENKLLRTGAEKCYIWPQGAYQYSIHDLSILNEAINQGFSVARASWMQPIRAQKNWDAMSKYQRMTLTCVGHQFKSPSGTVPESENIAEIIQRIQDCGKYGLDTFLQLHEIRPSNTADAEMKPYDIRFSDLELLLDAITAEITSGRMESVLMSDIVTKNNYWSSI